MLIKTKLQTTQLRSRLLLRDDLINRLCAAEAYPFIFISGPAGSGKSSLVVQWIRRKNLKVAWYSLDEEDNEPDLFFRYFLSAISRTHEQLHNALTPLLGNQRELVEENVIPQLIEFLSALSGNIRIVLDDFHQITNERIHAALGLLLQYIPSNLHLVILSRYSLPASVDAVAIKKDRLVLSAADLKFTEKETADLFNVIKPAAFSPDQIRNLNRHVEGWAAGLQLIGLALKNKKDFSDLSSILNQTHDQVANYLIHDILQMQPQKIRDFVFATALLDRFNPELCTEITGCANSVRILAHLEHLNLFIIPLDAQRKWYRYHHMFSEVIRRWVAISAPDLIPKTLRRSALWLARNTHLEDALRCAFRCNDLEFTADLIEDHIIQYAETFNIAAGLRWITKLPERILNQRALLRLQQCGFLSTLMELSEAKEILCGMEKNGKLDFSGYSIEKRSLCQDYTAYIKCTLHISYAGESLTDDQMKTLQGEFRPQNPLFISAVEMQMVFILILQGELAAAEALLAKQTGLALPTFTYLMRKKIYHAKAMTLIAQHRGQLRQAEAIVLQVQEVLNREGYGNSPMAFLLHRHLGSIFYHQNRLEEAKKCAGNVMKYRECEYFGLFDEIRAGSELRLQLHRAAGEYEQAAECIRQMQEYSIRLGIPQTAASADVCAALLAIDQDNLAVAELWSTRRKLQPSERFSLLFAMECLTLARLYHAQKKYPEAADLLKILRNRCLKKELAELVLQIDILQSAMLHAMNQYEEAAVLLEGTLIFAETEGYIRPFVNESTLIAPIIMRIAQKSSDTSTAVNIEKFIAAVKPDQSGPPQAHKVEGIKNNDLTHREMEILTWMAQGFQNKEIAQKAFIATTTVKSHVKNIMIKLNANSRIKAILRARETGILSNDSAITCSNPMPRPDRPAHAKGLKQI